MSAEDLTLLSLKSMARLQKAKDQIFRWFEVFSEGNQSLKHCKLTTRG